MKKTKKMSLRTLLPNAPGNVTMMPVKLQPLNQTFMHKPSANSMNVTMGALMEMASATNFVPRIAVLHSAIAMMH